MAGSPGMESRAGSIRWQFSPLGSRWKEGPAPRDRQPSLSPSLSWAPLATPGPRGRLGLGDHRARGGGAGGGGGAEERPPRRGPMCPGLRGGAGARPSRTAASASPSPAQAATDLSPGGGFL
ncbi:homeobox protein Hox-C12-like isoform X2 [Vombatus ursinus]|uniref:homeobox protein Hox-C12-like isoform X2 n=1 Tax=Vombatus ursinus TaxID=29139 RepID=UPI000FFD0DB5|nr:homeobox protein Hox-C12-like isoform X2 [Vombatus ursinus]